MAKDATQRAEQQTLPTTDAAEIAGELQNRGAVKAVCPLNPDHPGARVYRTIHRTRYCKCNTCGHQWKMSGPPSTPTSEWLNGLADKLAESVKDPQEVDGRPVIVLSLDSTKRLVKDLRMHSSLAAGSDAD